MAKRTDLKKILVIGSGPIVIGQAAEFDYAGTQACLALKEEGYEVVLCNSNPATIMTDTTIADYVADLRAPTPSAAAELAVYEYQALQNYLEDKRLKLKKGLYQKIQMERLKIERYRTKMRYLHPRTKLQQQQQRYVDLEQKLRLAMDKKLTMSKQRLAIYIERMKGLSPLTKLNQGFSYVASERGDVVKSIQDVKAEDSLTIYVTDGLIKTKVEETIKEDYGER